MTTTPAAEAPKTEFSALIADIGAQASETETLAKALDKDGDAKADVTIEGAAAEGAEGDAKKKDGECAGEAMGKSLKVIGADGVESEGIDATDLLKSLVDRVEALGAGSVEANTALLGVVKQQGALLKSLGEQVKALGAQGVGRRAILTVHDKGITAAETLSKSLGEPTGADGEKPAGMEPKEFLTKALDLAAAGKLSYRDVNMAETMINKGGQPLPEIVKVVMAAA